MRFPLRALLTWLTRGKRAVQFKLGRGRHSSFGSLRKQFTPPGKRILKRAEAEARKWNHEYIGTEHLLLGLLLEDDCTTPKLLRAFGTNSAGLASCIERFIASGPDAVTLVRLPLVPRVRKLIHDAAVSADSEGGKKIEPKHLLLALLNDDETVGFHVFKSSGIDPSAARRFLLDLV